MPMPMPMKFAAVRFRSANRYYWNNVLIPVSRRRQIIFLEYFINQNTKYYIQATLINKQNTKTPYKTAPAVSHLAAAHNAAVLL